MKIKELYSRLDGLIPPSYSCDWDNDGLMLCPDGDREAKKILFTLDVTAEAADIAIKGGFDLIVSHHPMIFNPLHSLEDRMIIALASAGISVFSFHTRLDAIDGGVNTVLAEKCGVEVTDSKADGFLGKIGEYDAPLSPSELAEKVKASLGSEKVTFVSAGDGRYSKLASPAGGEKSAVMRVAFLGGAGDYEEAEAALKAGCDAFVTGDIGYNAMIDLARAGMTVVAAGHYETENPVLSMLIKTVGELTDAELKRFDCKMIKTV